MSRRWSRSSAGHTCSVMNWAIGFRSLGWDVCLCRKHRRGKVSSLPAEPGQLRPGGIVSPKLPRKELGFEGLRLPAHRWRIAGLWKRFRISPPMRSFSSTTPASLTGSIRSAAHAQVLPRCRSRLYPALGGSARQRHEFLRARLFSQRGNRTSMAPTLPAAAGRPRLDSHRAAGRRRLAGASGSVLWCRRPPMLRWTTIGHWYGYPEMEGQWA